MRITSGGNVGIGTSSPTTYSLSGTHTEIFGGSTYSFLHVNTTTVKSFLASNESSLLTALFTFSNHPLTFGTNNTERMRITSGGDVGIGNTGGAGKLQVTGNAGVYTHWIQASSTSSQSYGMMINAGSSSTDYSFYVRSAAQGSPFIYIRGDGYLYSASAWSGSDRRLKENIIDLDNALNKVLKIKARKFDFINGFRNQYGFIAQELQEVIPDAVSVFDEKNGMLAIKMDFIVPHLVKAIQELKQELDTLKNK